MKLLHRYFTYALIITCSVMCSGSDVRGLGQERRIFYDNLKKAGVIRPASLVLIHFSHIGNLNVENELLYVLDVREIIPAMAAPRGLNKIVVFNKDFKLLHVIPYVDERPLRCDGNALLIFGDIVLDSGREGNLLIFSNKGKKICVDRIEWSKFFPDKPQLP